MYSKNKYGIYFLAFFSLYIASCNSFETRKNMKDGLEGEGVCEGNLGRKRNKPDEEASIPPEALLKDNDLPINKKHKIHAAFYITGESVDICKLTPFSGAKRPPYDLHLNFSTNNRKQQLTVKKRDEEKPIEYSFNQVNFMLNLQGGYTLFGSKRLKEIECEETMLENNSHNITTLSADAFNTFNRYCNAKGVELIEDGEKNFIFRSLKYKSEGNVKYTLQKLSWKQIDLGAFNSLDDLLEDEIRKCPGYKLSFLLSICYSKNFEDFQKLARFLSEKDNIEIRIRGSGITLSSISTICHSKGCDDFIDLIEYIFKKGGLANLAVLKGAGIKLSSSSICAYKGSQDFKDLLEYICKDGVLTNLAKLKKEEGIALSSLSNICSAKGSKDFIALLSNIRNKDVMDQITELKEAGIDFSSLSSICAGKGSKDFIALLRNIRNKDVMDQITELKEAGIDFSSISNICSHKGYKDFIALLSYIRNKGKDFMNQITELKEAGIDFSSLSNICSSKGSKDFIALLSNIRNKDVMDQITELKEAGIDLSSISNICAQKGSQDFIALLRNIRNKGKDFMNQITELKKAGIDFSSLSIICSQKGSKDFIALLSNIRNKDVMNQITELKKAGIDFSSISNICTRKGSKGFISIMKIAFAKIGQLKEGKTTLEKVIGTKSTTRLDPALYEDWHEDEDEDDENMREDEEEDNVSIPDFKKDEGGPDSNSEDERIVSDPEEQENESYFSNKKNKEEAIVPKKSKKETKKEKKERKNIASQNPKLQITGGLSSGKASLSKGTYSQGMQQEYSIIDKYFKTHFKVSTENIMQIICSHNTLPELPAPCNVTYPVLKNKLQQLILQNMGETVFAPVKKLFIDEKIGCGLFATKTIKAEDIIGIYTGRIEKYDARKRYAMAWNYPAYSQEVFSSRLMIDANEATLLQYVNSSSNQDDCNIDVWDIEIEGKVFLVYVANRKIITNKQLLVAYGSSYWENLGIEPISLREMNKIMKSKK